MNPSIDDFLSSTPAALVLASGEVFSGVSLGANGHSVGEVVFNTAMTGYQEILTDPSYAEQLVTLTYPHIGNVGINDGDSESSRPWANGLIIRDESLVVSNWRATQSLRAYLQQHNIVAIAGVDTRRLTRLLRDKGAVAGCIISGEVDLDRALQLAKDFPGLTGMDLACRVSTASPYEWTEPTYRFPEQAQASFNADKHVVVMDFGVKQQMLRLLVDRGCKVTVVPATTTADEVAALQPNGVLLSNGPGDPAACDYAIHTIQDLLAQSLPIFGICLGYQMLALALGASTIKMKFGHHGANHPVQTKQSGRVMITSQNHGFAVDADTLPAEVEVTHASLFDGSLQGFAHASLPVFGFQGHPESSPGPQDIEPLFDHFIELIAARQSAAATEKSHA